MNEINNIEEPRFGYKIVAGSGNIDDAKAIRKQVFQGEQNVDPRIEEDDKDELATHIIIYDGEKPVGTARLFENNGQNILGRVATLSEYRGKGIGKLAITELVKYAFENGIDRVDLHSQTHVAEFYKKLGFTAYGDEFEEAGIPHISMYKQK